ncbi:MAG: hypothetical protein R3B45_06570 [Bdellovibrionota bacterium]
MFFTSLTIEDLVDITLSQKIARRIIDDLPIELADIRKILIQHFRIMGIYKVESLKIGRLLQDNMIFVLNNSQDIRKMIKDAQIAQEKSRKRTIAD